MLETTEVQWRASCILHFVLLLARECEHTRTRTLVTRHRGDQSCLAIYLYICSLCTSLCPYLPGSPGILFDEPCCGTCYTVYCACTPTYTCTISYIYPPIYVKSYHAHAHAICADLAGHETGDPSVEAEIGKRGGVHGSAAEITQYAAMSTSHCRNRRLLVLVRWDTREYNYQSVYPYGQYFELSLTR